MEKNGKELDMEKSISVSKIAVLWVWKVIKSHWGSVSVGLNYNIRWKR